MAKLADHKTQIDRFKEAARELETDQSEEAFDAVLAKIAKAPKLSDEEIKKLAQKSRAKAKD